MLSLELGFALTIGHRACFCEPKAQFVLHSGRVDRQWMFFIDKELGQGLLVVLEPRRT
jgi:hypothetical protein